MDNFDFIRELFSMTGVTAEQLDEAWRKFCVTGNPKPYNQLKDQAKLAGKIVYRNSQGKHLLK